MSEQNSTGWPFGQAAGEGLDISAIFGTGTADPNRNPLTPQERPCSRGICYAAPLRRLSRRPPQRLSRRLLRHLSCRPLRHLSHNPPRHLSHSPLRRLSRRPLRRLSRRPPRRLSRSLLWRLNNPPIPLKRRLPSRKWQTPSKTSGEKAHLLPQGAKEPIEDPTITFEELRICKAETLWIWKRAKLSPGQWNTAASERKSRTPRGRPSPL